MMNKKNWYTTEEPSIFFEDTSVGRMKKQLWEASEEEIDRILEEYGIPSPSELGNGKHLYPDHQPLQGY